MKRDIAQNTKQSLTPSAHHPVVLIRLIEPRRPYGKLVKETGGVIEEITAIEATAQGENADNGCHGAVRPG